MTELTEKQRDSLDEDQFAFPKERKEPSATPAMCATRSPDSIRSKACQTTSATPLGAASSPLQKSMAWRLARRAGASSAK